MPVELGIWRVDAGVRAVAFSAIDQEERLEEILDSNVEIVDPNLMVIGRQVRTAFDKYIDLLAIDISGNLTVLELKRDRTYRDIVAQVLDYGSWVRTLRDEDIGLIYRAYVERYHPQRSRVSINEAFCERFAVSTMPDELNGEHRLVIVSSGFDASTERIVSYLAEEYDVSINAVFLSFFRDDDREYLGRAWLRDPADVATGKTRKGERGAWNHEFYVTFGLSNERTWEEARKYGFVAAGGGWWGEQLEGLSVGDRIWVLVPGHGYVGVGQVTEERVPVNEFLVDRNGEKVPITELPLKIAAAVPSGHPSLPAEYLVRVQWLKTVPLAEAVRERGFFANQNVVARPRTPSWSLTVERLKQVFGITS